LPYELWRGIDAAKFEKLLGAIEIPPRSQALHGLWRRLMKAPIHAAPNPDEAAKFEAIRLEALFRSGLTADVAELMSTAPPASQSPAMAVLFARAAIAEGRDDEACGQTQTFLRDLPRIPKLLAGEAVLISGYCVARSGKREAAGVAAGFAREQGVGDRPGLAALDAIAHGGKPALKGNGAVSLIDYKLLAHAGFTDTGRILPKASPALLVSLSHDAQASAEARAAAGEAAARLNAISADRLAELYRAVGSVPGSEATSRAAMFVEAEREQPPSAKARAIRHYLDEARRAELYMKALRTMSLAVGDLRPSSELAAFAETAIEVLIASDDPHGARAWLDLADARGEGGRLAHWRTLIDIADASSGRSRGSLKPLEELAVRGGFPAAELHRVITVLDALDYDIPIPLWDAASQTPQPATGYLPETGVLSELQEAAKAKEFDRTVLLAMNALGPKGAEGAHIIALGDAIRGLRQAGLETEARRLGFEALFLAWPRQING